MQRASSLASFQTAQMMVDDYPMTLSLPIPAEANELLSRNPLALLTAMLLDQQVPLEKAFSSPYELVRRLGHEPTAAEIAEFDPDALAEVFAQRPALHRFPRAMAGRVQELAATLVADYDGDAARVWTNAATGAELVARLAKLPGFGEYKAQITTALLGKQLGVRPAGWREAAGRFGEDGSYYSVADIVDGASLAAVRAHKKELKAAARSAASR
jgi:uncharacterized HhH-GPD family protein